MTAPEPNEREREIAREDLAKAGWYTERARTHLLQEGDQG